VKEPTLLFSARIYLDVNEFWAHDWADADRLVDKLVTLLARASDNASGELSKLAWDAATWELCPENEEATYADDVAS
jgi:hypothetical protein